MLLHYIISLTIAFACVFAQDDAQPNGQAQEQGTSGNNITELIAAWDALRPLEAHLDATWTQMVLNDPNALSVMSYCEARGISIPSDCTTDFFGDDTAEMTVNAGVSSKAAEACIKRLGLDRVPGFNPFAQSVGLFLKMSQTASGKDTSRPGEDEGYTIEQRREGGRAAQQAWEDAHKGDAVITDTTLAGVALIPVVGSGLAALGTLAVKVNAYIDSESAYVSGFVAPYDFGIRPSLRFEDGDWKNEAGQIDMDPFKGPGMTTLQPEDMTPNTGGHGGSDDSSSHSGVGNEDSGNSGSSTDDNDDTESNAGNDETDDTDNNDDSGEDLFESTDDEDFDAFPEKGVIEPINIDLADQIALNTCIETEELNIFNKIGTMHVDENAAIEAEEKRRQAEQELANGFCDVSYWGFEYCKQWEDALHTTIDPDAPSELDKQQAAAALLASGICDTIFYGIDFCNQWQNELSSTPVVTDDLGIEVIEGSFCPADMLSGEACGQLSERFQERFILPEGAKIHLARLFSTSARNADANANRVRIRLQDGMSGSKSAPTRVMELDLGRAGVNLRRTDMRISSFRGLDSPVLAVAPRIRRAEKLKRPMDHREWVREAMDVKVNTKEELHDEL